MNKIFFAFLITTTFATLHGANSSSSSANTKTAVAAATSAARAYTATTNKGITVNVFDTATEHFHSPIKTFEVTNQKDIRALFDFCAQNKDKAPKIDYSFERQKVQKMGHSFLWNPLTVKVDMNNLTKALSEKD